jgi:hypothetical protein
MNAVPFVVAGGVTGMVAGALIAGHGNQPSSTAVAPGAATDRQVTWTTPKAAGAIAGGVLAVGAGTQLLGSTGVAPRSIGALATLAGSALVCGSFSYLARLGVDSE